MNLRTIIVLSLTASVVGCGVEKQKVNSTNSELNHATASVGKPSAPIDMSYRVLTEKPVPGQEIEIQVVFSSSLKSTVSANMKSAEGLTWASPEKSWQANLSKSGEYGALPNLKVIAPADGVYYLHLNAQVMDNGIQQSKPFVIPINVGDAERVLDSPGEIITDGKGQKVIIQKVDSSN